MILQKTCIFCARRTCNTTFFSASCWQNLADEDGLGRLGVEEDDDSRGQCHGLLLADVFEVTFLSQRQGVLEFGLGADANKIIEHLSLRVSTEVEG